MISSYFERCLTTFARVISQISESNFGIHINEPEYKANKGGFFFSFFAFSNIGSVGRLGNETFYWAAIIFILRLLSSRVFFVCYVTNHLNTGVNPFNS